MEQNKNSTSYLIPLSIIVAAVIVAGAIIFSGSSRTTPDTGTTAAADSAGQASAPQAPTNTSLENVRPVGDDDHILGNPDAPIMIVEYSDYECPFCKRFHFTMKKIMDEYGKKGQVAWVYRHFPIEGLHPKNAKRVAATAECVADQAGDAGFWAFTDGFFSKTPSNDQTDLSTVIPEIISTIDGVDINQVNECVASGKYDEHIQDDFNNALQTGGQGTPWSIIITKSGKKFPLNGALPYRTVKSLIDTALTEK